MSASIAVIIPYFQRTPGVLARTLTAVFAQCCAESLHVIVVDDASPAPAAAELTTFGAAERAMVHVIRQKNGGPAVARNTGLAAVPAGIDYVALLDSDDIWHPDHIARGMLAMEHGFDLYFADCRREHDVQTAFELNGMTPSPHRLVDAESGLYQWRSDLFEACLEKSIIGLSTVLLRRSAFTGLTFRDDIGIADDIFFAVEVARRSSKIAFSFSEDAVYTVAENISVISDWRSNKSLRLVMSLSLCYHKILAEYQVTDSQRAFLITRIRKTRVEFATILLSLLCRGERIRGDHFRRFLRTDRGLPAELVKTGFRMAGKLLSPRLLSPGRSAAAP